MPEKRSTGRFGYEVFTPAKSYPPMTVGEQTAAFGDAQKEAA